MKKSAIIHGEYRYELRRSWDKSANSVLFICLNPSKADANNDDQTSRKCIDYAKRWGYGGLLLGNLFALCSTDPGQLRLKPDPVGPDNDKYLKKMLNEASLVVCAWG